MPVPATLIVSPVAKLVPVIVTWTVVPCVPVAGDMLDAVGTGNTVKVAAALTVEPFETVKLRAPVEAFVAMTS